MLHTIHLPSNNIIANVKTKREVNSDVVEMESIECKIGIEIAKQVDNKLLQAFYEIYKKSDIAMLYVIDETEFYKFMITYLPIYVKEKYGREEAQAKEFMEKYMRADIESAAKLNEMLNLERKEKP